MLRKLLLVFVLCLSFSLIGFCLPENDLDNIEFMQYGHCYDYEPLGERLNRLETDFFGMSQSGNIDERVLRLSEIAANSKKHTVAVPSFYDNLHKKKSSIKDFWNTASSMFNNGVITGFTPPITSYDYYSSPGSLYRNEFTNFSSNPSIYCPYHNRYDSLYNNFTNSSRTFSQYNNIPRPPHYINGNYPVNSYYHQSFYNPPNIYSGSSVHIIRD
ncbi:hypothetical protein IJ182_09650 [bacterium]|nr:hypothetical protein [bacterium]